MIEHCSQQRTADGRLQYRVTASCAGLPVRRILKNEMRLTEHQIRRAKFRPDGILCNGKQVRVSCLAEEGSVLSVLIADEISSETKSGSKDDPEGSGFLSDLEDSSVSVRRSIENLRILYEDEDLLAVDKPAGMPVHRGRGHWGNTLADQVCAYLHVSEAAVHIVGRLDRDTSGIVVFAKNAVAAQRLSAQPRSVHYKRYLAVVRGIPDIAQEMDTAAGNNVGRSVKQENGQYPDSTGRERPIEPENTAGIVDTAETENIPEIPDLTKNWHTIDLPVRKQPGTLNRMETLHMPYGCAVHQKCTKDGAAYRKFMEEKTDAQAHWQQAVTSYRVLESVQLPDGAVSLIEAVPITGRTHQIRVHMAALGCPLLADPIYDFTQPEKLSEPEHCEEAEHGEEAEQGEEAKLGEKTYQKGQVYQSKQVEHMDRQDRDDTENSRTGCMFLRCMQACLYHPFTGEMLALSVNEQGRSAERQHTR